MARENNVVLVGKVSILRTPKHNKERNYNYGNIHT